MREMDKLHLKRPFFGVLRMHAYLQKMGYSINVKRVVRLFKVMGISAIYQKPNLSEANKSHEIYPYLLKSIDINHSTLQHAGCGVCGSGL